MKTARSSTHTRSTRTENSFLCGFATRSFTLSHDSSTRLQRTTRHWTSALHQRFRHEVQVRSTPCRCRLRSGLPPCAGRHTEPPCAPRGLSRVCFGCVFCMPGPLGIALLRVALLDTGLLSSPSSTVTVALLFNFSSFQLCVSTGG